MFFIPLPKIIFTMKTKLHILAVLIAKVQLSCGCK